MEILVNERTKQLIAVQKEYEQVCEQQKKCIIRNEALLRYIQRIRQSTCAPMSTAKLETLKSQYFTQVAELYPEWAFQAQGCFEKPTGATTQSYLQHDSGLQLHKYARTLVSLPLANSDKGCEGMTIGISPPLTKPEGNSGILIPPLTKPEGNSGIPIPPLTKPEGNSGIPILSLTKPEGNSIPPLTKPEGNIIPPLSKPEGHSIPPLSKPEGHSIPPPSKPEGNSISPLTKTEGNSSMLNPCAAVSPNLVVNSNGDLNLGDSNEDQSLLQDDGDSTNLDSGGCCVFEAASGTESSKHQQKDLAGSEATNPCIHAPASEILVHAPVSKPLLAVDQLQATPTNTASQDGSSAAANTILSQLHTANLHLMQGLQLYTDEDIVGPALLDQLRTFASSMGHVLPLGDQQNTTRPPPLASPWGPLWGSLVEHFQLLCDKGKTLDNVAATFASALAPQHLGQQEATQQLLSLLRHHITVETSSSTSEHVTETVHLNVSALNESAAYRSLILSMGAMNDSGDDDSDKSSSMNSTEALPIEKLERSDDPGPVMVAAGITQVSTPVAASSPHPSSGLRTLQSPPTLTSSSEDTSSHPVSPVYVPTAIENRPQQQKLSNLNKLGFWSDSDPEDIELPSLKKEDEMDF